MMIFYVDFEVQKTVDFAFFLYSLDFTGSTDLSKSLPDLCSAVDVRST